MKIGIDWYENVNYVEKRGQKKDVWATEGIGLMINDRAQIIADCANTNYQTESNDKIAFVNTGRSWQNIWGCE